MAERRVQQQKILSLFKFIQFPNLWDPDQTSQSDEGMLAECRKIHRLPKGNSFSTFDWEHMTEAMELYTRFLLCKSFETFHSLACIARPIFNDGLFVFTLTWAVQDSEACAAVQSPPLYETNPDLFIPAKTLQRALRRYVEERQKMPLIVKIDPTGDPLTNPEHRVAYFREDVGINSHHWHWHQVYPFRGKSKDRKGELFYYMHQQMCARYDCERLSVGLNRVVPFYELNETLEGYSSHLRSLNEDGIGGVGGSRPDGLHIREAKHLQRWHERIMSAIDKGYLVDRDSKHVPLDAVNGIVRLGDTLEPSTDSVNREYYGNLHNGLHNACSVVHDPEEKFKEFIGAVGNGATAVRDPIFYRLHRFVDDLFNMHKMKLPAYRKEELEFPGVEVRSAEVKGVKTNVIRTNMKTAHIELNHAIPFETSVKVEFTHLDHEQFTFKICANNSTGKEKMATVRIFLAPAHNEKGESFQFPDVRRFFIELDKFPVKLKKGETKIYRHSSESSISRSQIPPTFEELQSEEFFAKPQVDDFYCKCGWPENLLVPKGTPHGMEFQLFVMLTDYTEDAVDESGKTEICKNAGSYCGVKDGKYPDKKPMGFPFDRNIANRDDFKTPNMIFTSINIIFKNEEAEH